MKARSPSCVSRGTTTAPHRKLARHAAIHSERFLAEMASHPRFDPMLDQAGGEMLDAIRQRQVDPRWSPRLSKYATASFSPPSEVAISDCKVEDATQSANQASGVAITTCRLLRAGGTSSGHGAISRDHISRLASNEAIDVVDELVGEPLHRLVTAQATCGVRMNGISSSSSSGWSSSGGPWSARRTGAADQTFAQGDHQVSFATNPPRAVLISSGRRFMARNSGIAIMSRVSGSSGECRVMTSLVSSTSSQGYRGAEPGSAFVRGE